MLVEGNIDVITLHQAGFDNVVGHHGHRPHRGARPILARYTKELVLCYDNDTAGKQSTDRVLNILKNANLNVRVLQLPNAYDAEGKPVKQDPDDFVKKFGPAAFEKCLNGRRARTTTGWRPSSRSTAWPTRRGAWPSSGRR
ncbi:MAG: toprim domain-containing protein [Flavonifractor plautii]